MKTHYLTFHHTGNELVPFMVECESRDEVLRLAREDRDDLIANGKPEMHPQFLVNEFSDRVEVKPL